MMYSRKSQVVAERLAWSAGKPAAVILDQTALLALGPEWEELVTHAVQENPYYARKYVTAQLTHIEKRPVQALAIWYEHKLIALLPFVCDPWRWGGIAYVNKSWTTPYTTLSVPLIDARFADTASKALVAAMTEGVLGSSTWLLLDMTMKGPALRHLSHALKERGLEWTCFDAFERAILSRAGSFEEHQKTHLSKNRRKSLARNRRRLEEMGKLSLETYSEGDALDEALQHFLQLEEAGWKGKSGTALASSPHTKAFAEMAFGSTGATLAHPPATRIDLLMLDENPIAASVSIQVGRTTFTLKSAFDENFRNQSPGLVLEEAIIREFLDGNWADRLDSAADAGHVLENLWNGTVTVGDILVTTNETNAKWFFKLFTRLEATRRSARLLVKRALQILKR
ncbi:MAG: GNAT family N-acetyltransferase [Parvibaculum sp.]